MEEVIESNKRGAKLCHAGYMYTKTAVRKNKIWWKCSKRAGLNCRASVSTSLDSKNPVPRIRHNHQPEEAEVEYAKFRNQMRNGQLEEKQQKTKPSDDDGTGNQRHHNNNNNNPHFIGNSKFLHRRRKLKTSQRCSAKDVLPHPFLSSIVDANHNPMPPTPNLMTMRRLNQLASLKSLGLPNKMPQFSENGQNLFPRMQMNLSNNSSDKSQALKRPAPLPPPISVSREELEDVKPCKRQLDAQNSMQEEQNRSQVTPTGHHTYPKMSSAQQTHSNPGHQSSQTTQNQPKHHSSGQQAHLQLPTSHSNHLQPTTSGHQSGQMTQSQQAHSRITIVSQSRHVTTGQLNHKVSVSQPKTNATTPSNPFQVLTSQQTHQMTSGQKIHQNVTMGQQNPHQVVVDQPMTIEVQSQSKISTGHQKRKEPSPAQLRFQTNRIEAISGQQRRENTLQESFKTQPEIADCRLKQSSAPDSTYRDSASTMSLVPLKNKKTFVVSKHQHTVMSCLAALWKDNKLCDASIGNGTFKIMVHKVILLAISPKLLSQANVKANCFIRVNLPEEVSQAALVAFSEYMYYGVLTLDPILLRQQRIIATQLGIRELELLCDTHLMYCDLQNPPVNTDLDLSAFELPINNSMSTDLSENTCIVPESRTIKHEEVCEEFSLNSSQALLKDFTLPIKMEPLDPESSSRVQSIFNSSMSPNASRAMSPNTCRAMSPNTLNNTKYIQNNFEAPPLFGGQGNEQSFHSMPSDFEPPTIPFRQGTTDSLLELNDILQLTKFLKKSDLTHFDSSDTFDSSTISLSPDPCESQNEDIFDQETDPNPKMNPATNTDDPFRPSKKPPAASTSQRTSQPLEVLKETAELLTFQITDVRSVHRKINIT